ncbi:MAG: DNA-formamidopyrimidine glycosylase [Candidatus Zambryskibacteria bacterium RIFCSPHIGHO2_01_FULL_43_27]|uniref:DNA-formamidopyrimidine glycosylase n=1 Tax=Candidatus Zambryskibacteria bacterium RIFCSPLOWO2_01_FULL_43_17 TaxID=1802760 RepID=A0A1G2U519_9BACT|nr:MAG: DNA-formamidopyrimidine glycosylase [Candidatus Zambryskibacteria bacterium RIFCSPHIGHO2_01_FULL_43_27]OHB00459.1 MAG: DNA-formamidopyrimidine glycosylase [Candidatus Zambryskibacteria bacterium RIFCSPHIGHO2_12_FULL_43_12b]OHB04591.1 MAG: DNA-formamidopyrimidine glycosylase [Candidatus Zambryskibacteria bacterium RIFCSPLOWO2_01_FULL_43_17]
MPELPEVQTTVDGINLQVRGLKIADVWTDYYSHLYENHKQIKSKKFFRRFKKDVLGTKILKAERRAKNILIHLSNEKIILIHMKMTGHLLYGKYKLLKNKWVAIERGPLRDDPFNRFVHFVMSLSNDKHLVLSDMRKFAKITVFSKEELNKEFSQTGPEPLTRDFTLKKFKECLSIGRQRNIKQILMDQGVIAGIGNIYSDEILWASGIHPLSRVEKLKAVEISNLWKNLKVILRKGIRLGGDSMSDYRDISGKRGKFQLEHQAYRRTGESCRKSGCKGVIRRIIVGGRSAHYCDKHQKLYA